MNTIASITAFAMAATAIKLNDNNAHLGGDFTDYFHHETIDGARDEFMRRLEEQRSASEGTMNGLIEAFNTANGLIMTSEQDRKESTETMESELRAEWANIDPDLRVQDVNM